MSASLSLALRYLLRRPTALLATLLTAVCMVSWTVMFALAAAIPPASIAVAASNSAQTLLMEEPKVAMLSFSTNGSAKHESVDKVRNAAQLVKQRCPGIAVDQDVQLDAAIVTEIAAKKLPDSEVKGQSNVLIFPNLEAGNIGYKLAERLGGAVAIGPLLQGLNQPANDLSRGCSAEDIFNVIAVTAVQAQQGKVSSSKADTEADVEEKEESEFQFRY